MEIQTSPSITIKILQDSALRPGTGGAGELGMFNRFVRSGSNRQLSLASLFKQPGDLISNHINQGGFDFLIDRQERADFLVVLPVREGNHDMTYDEELFFGYFEAWVPSLIESVGADAHIHLLMNTPGVLDNPSDAEQARRWAKVEAVVDAYPQVSIQLVWSRQDFLLYNTITDADTDTIRDLRLTQTDLLFLGSRNIESTLITPGAVAREYAKSLLEVLQPTRVVTPVAVGANLSMIEAAVECEVPVVAYHFSDRNNWAPLTERRWRIALQSNLVEEVGVEEYVPNRINDIYLYLAEHAALSHSTIVKLGRNASEITAVRNFGRDDTDEYEQLLNSIRQTQLGATPAGQATPPAPELVF